MVMATGLPQGQRVNPRFTLEVTPGMSITNAIANADALGGDWTILVYPGTYDESDITPNGGANITLKGMGTGRVEIAPTGAAVAAVVISGFQFEIHDIRIVAFDNTTPALRVVGGFCRTSRCALEGQVAGRSIEQIAGELQVVLTYVNEDIHLSTDDCTFRMLMSEFENGNLLTAADGSAHIIELRRSNFNLGNINSLAIGACTFEIHNCMAIATLTDSSLLGTGHLCQCDVLGAGLVVNGTSAWIADNCMLNAVSNTDATTTATIVVFAGFILAITRAVGSVVWWKDGNTLKVIPSGTITDPVIGWAVAAAAAGDIIVIHPGTYTEPVVLAAGINLKGIDKESCIIDIDHATLVTMAAGCSISELTLNVTGDVTADGIGVECNDATCTIENCDISLVRTGSNARAISEQSGATARVIYVRNVRVVSDTTTNEAAIYCDQAGKTFYIKDCWLQGGDYAIYCDAASTFYVDNSHAEVNVVPPGGGITIYAAAATMYFRSCTIEKNISTGNLGTIRLKNCSYRQISRTGTGNIVDESPDLKDAPWHTQRWSWQAALANAQVSVRGTPLDAGTGQVLLQIVDDDLADVEAVESGAEHASALSNKLTPARTPRFITQISVDSFDEHVTMFFGLRETLGDVVPGAAEDHAGFIWDGINFKSSSDDGTATQENNLTIPSTDTHHELEVIVFGGLTTVGWVEFSVDGVLVETHNTRIPVVDLDWQHLLPTEGDGDGDQIDVTVRGGGVQQCPA